MEDVNKLVDMKEIIEVTRRVFKEKARGQTQMPSKIYIFLKEFKGDFRVMPAYIPTEMAAGVKIVNVHPDNRKFNLPTVMGTIIILNPSTGEPISIMDGTLLTSIRTGAAGAITAQYLAKKNIAKVALIGCGTQAKYQLLGLISIYGNSWRASIYDISKEAENKLATFAKEQGLDVYIAEDIKGCVKDSDIIATTTPSTKPILKNEWILDGVHINAIGADAPGKEELDPDILKRAKIYVDDIDQASHSGEINIPISRGLINRSDIVGEVGELIEGTIKGRTDENDITIFDSTGLAIQDIAVATIVYKKAMEKGIGSLLKLF